MIALIIAISVAGMIIYPLFDFIFAKLFTHSDFVYSVKEHVYDPVSIGTLSAIVFWSIDKKINKVVKNNGRK